MMFPLEYHLQATHYKPPDVEPKILHFKMTCFTDIKNCYQNF